LGREFSPKKKKKNSWGKKIYPPNGEEEGQFLDAQRGDPTIQIRKKRKNDLQKRESLRGKVNDLVGGGTIFGGGTLDTFQKTAFPHKMKKKAPVGNVLPRENNFLKKKKERK